MKVVIERIPHWPEPDTHVRHLYDRKDPDALWQPFLCGDGDGIAFPGYDNVPPALVCCACKKAKAATPHPPRKDPRA